MVVSLRTHDRHRILTAALLCGHAISLSVPSTANTPEDYGDLLVSRVMTSLSASERRVCWDYASVSANDPGATLINKGVFRGMISQCAAAIKADTLDTFLARKRPWQTLVEPTRLHDDSKPKTMALSNLPRFFRDRINPEDMSCLETGLPDVPTPKAIRYTTIAPLFQRERVEIEHSDFHRLASQIHLTETVHYMGLDAKFTRAAKTSTVLLPFSKVTQSVRSVWLEGIGPDSITVDQFKRAGDTVSRSARLNHKDGSVHYQDVVLTLRFEGCATASVDEADLKTSLWSITDPAIVPGFKYQQGFGLDALQARTKILEISTDIGWIVNYAYQTDRLTIMKWTGSSP